MTFVPRRPPARTQNSGYFVEWIPHAVQTALTSVPSSDSPLSATFVSNSTSVQDLLRRTHGQFASLFRRRAFLHWYTGEGMDEQEFQDAEANVIDLVAEYQQYQEAALDDDEYEEGLVGGEHVDEEEQ